MITVVFAVAMVYFCFGYVFGVVVRGENGFEALPHFKFWMSLPDLCRDGATFCMAKSQLKGPTQDSSAAFASLANDDHPCDKDGSKGFDTI